VQYVVFSVGSEAYGIEIEYVQEIIRVPGMVKVPRTPPYLEGLANLRGNILTVVNTSVRFGLEKQPLSDASRVIVLDDGRKRLGFIVDKVSEVVNIAADEIEEVKKEETRAEFLKGIARLAAGERLVMVLDPAHLMKTEETRDRVTGAVESLGLARAEEKKKEEKEEKVQLVSFRVGEEEYGVDIGMVQEIVHLPETINRVPDAPAYLLGIITLRNHVLPVVSLRALFQLKDKEMDDRARIVVVNLCDQQKRNFSVGLVVDAVTEVLRISRAVIDPVPVLLRTGGGEGISGVCKIAEGKRLVYVLDPAGSLALGDLLKVGGAVDSGEEEEVVSMDEQEEQLVTFKLGKEEFAAGISEVREIIRVPDIVAVPKAPHFVEGVINLRGTIIPIIDLRKRFGMEESARDEHTRVVVVEIDGLLTGLVVDSAREVLKVSRLAIEATPDLLTGSVDTRFIRGIAKAGEGERLIIVLNMKEVLSFKEKEELVDFGRSMEIAEGPGIDS
jgi:purine-binding chemotaxis protein CheW